MFSSYPCEPGASKATISSPCGTSAARAPATGRRSRCRRSFSKSRTRRCPRAASFPTAPSSMPAPIRCAEPAGSISETIWAPSWRFPEGARGCSGFLVPDAGEGAARQEVGRLGLLLQQVLERARNLADEAVCLLGAELGVGGLDRADVKLPLAGAFLRAFGHEALGNREAAQARRAVEDPFDPRAERCLELRPLPLPHETTLPRRAAPAYPVVPAGGRGRQNFVRFGTHYHWSPEKEPAHHRGQRRARRALAARRRRGDPELDAAWRSLRAGARLHPVHDGLPAVSSRAAPCADDRAGRGFA